MNVVQLTASSFEEFLNRRPVAIVLFFTPADASVIELLHAFAALASTFDNSFNEHVAFGTVDLTTTENLELMEKGIEMITPAMHSYICGKADCDVYGHQDILEVLNDDEIARNLIWAQRSRYDYWRDGPRSDAEWRGCFPRF
jgi:hypothetical protein